MKLLPGSGYGYLIVLLWLAACHRPYYIHKESASIYSIERSSAADSSMVNMLLPYRHQMQQVMQDVIAYNDTMLIKAQPESTLGNLLADAQLYAARKKDSSVHLSIANYGGIRLPYLAAGPVTIGKMYELMPFDNSIVIALIPGGVMKEFCNHIATSGGWPISGMRFVIKDKRATGIEINGKPLDTALTYKVAINDYMAGGGDNCSFLKPLEVRPVNIFVRDALIDYVKFQKQVRVGLEKRIYYAQ